MFGLEILEVLVGLVFVYFVFSVVASGLTEVVAGLLGLRASNLADGVKAILQNDKDALKKFYNHAAIKALSPPGSRWFFLKNRPSYVPPQVFAEVASFVKNSAGNAAIKNETAAAVNAALRVYSGSEVEQMEKLFNDTMERATGWYKRKAAFFVLLFGALVVSFSNADTFAMVDSLWQDSAARDGIVALAEQQQASAPSLEDATELRGAVSQLGLLGWIEPDAAVDDPRERPYTTWGWVVKIAGLAVTVGAVSMGAPFWYDLLTLLLKHKPANTGAKP